MKRCNQPIDQTEHASKKVALVSRNPEPNEYPLVNAYTVGRSAPDDLVQLAQEIQKADSFITANACNKLQVIAQQIQFLKKSAENVLLQARINHNLHHAACNFVKVPGNIYHLYKKSTTEDYFSILSPQEWGNPPHTFLGSFRLEHDHSWTPIKEIDKMENDLLLIRDLINPIIEDSSVLNVQCSLMEF